MTCELDKQGRILLPNNLREFAELEKDVVFIGVSTRVEIWSKENWDASMAVCDEDMDEIAESLAALGFGI